MQVSNAIGSPGFKASMSSWRTIPQIPSASQQESCFPLLQEGWGHLACSIPSDSWDTTSLPIKPRCHQLNWKVAGLHSCQRTWVWPVVFAFLVAKAEQSERAGQLSQPKLSLWIWQFKGKENHQKQAKVFPFLCQAPLTAIAICSPIPKDPSCNRWCQLVLGSLRRFTRRTVCGPCQSSGKSCRRWFCTVQLKDALKY